MPIYTTVVQGERGILRSSYFPSLAMAKAYAAKMPGVIAIQESRPGPASTVWPVVWERTKHNPVSKQAKKFLAKKFSRLKKEDYKGKRRVALALSMARRAGFKIPKKPSKNPIWIPTKEKDGSRKARRVPTWKEFQTPGFVESESYLSNPNEIDRRGAIVLAPTVLEICTDRKKYYLNYAALMLGLADGSVLIRGFRGPKPDGNLEYIIYEDRAKSAREGQALDKPWKHDVKSVTTMHLTSQGLLITSKEAPLWAIR